MVGIGATGILIFKEAGFVNFALRCIFVLPMVSGLVLEEYSGIPLPCWSIRSNTLIFKEEPFQSGKVQSTLSSFLLYAVVKTALSKRLTVCFWASRLHSLSFKEKAVRKT